MYCHKKILSLFIIITALVGCEYNLTKENYLDIEKPSETQFFNLSLIPSGDTLRIFEKTTLTFDIDADGKEILLSTITFKGKTEIFYSNEYVLDPEDFAPGIDTLTLGVYLNSGSGSIADYYGAERYYVEKKWIMITDNRTAPTIVPTKRINKDGFLIIEWDKCGQYNFEGYEIGCSTQLESFSITDPDHNYYIDSLYVGDDYHINVSCRLSNDHAWGESLDFYEEPPIANIEEIAYDSIKISWDKSPYNAEYRLRYKNNDVLYFGSPGDTMCIVPQIGFGNWEKFELRAKSLYSAEWPDVPFYHYVTSYTEYYMGERIISANWPEFIYNYTDKCLYSNEYNTVRCFNPNDYSEINSTEAENVIYGGTYSCPTNSSKVAVTSKDDIYIFNDKGLSPPIVINFKDWGANSIDHLLLTDKDLLAYVYNKQYKMVDINSKTEICSITISDYPVYSKWACISTSQDAKYMCVATNNGIKIHTIDNDNISETYSDSRNYRSVYFNPYNPGQLYITLNEESGIEIRNPSDFSLIDKIDISPEMVIQNIDPETDKLLLTDYERLYVVGIKAHEVLLEIPCDESKCWLYNNHIFTNTGYGMELP